MRGRIGGEQSAHRETVRVRLFDKIGLSAEPGWKIEAAEHAQPRPGATRRITLASLHRVEERVARILLGPEHHQPARIRQPRPALEARRRIRVEPTNMPREVVFLGRARRAVVGVTRSDQPESEGIRADRRLLSSLPTAEIYGTPG